MQCVRERQAAFPLVPNVFAATAAAAAAVAVTIVVVVVVVVVVAVRPVSSQLDAQTKRFYFVHFPRLQPTPRLEPQLNRLQRNTMRFNCLNLQHFKAR